MKSLAEQIRCELELKTQTMGHCAIYEDELQRKWPLEEKGRAVCEELRIPFEFLQAWIVRNLR